MRVGREICPRKALEKFSYPIRKKKRKQEKGRVGGDQKGGWTGTFKKKRPKTAQKKKKPLGEGGGARGQKTEKRGP